MGTNAIGMGTRNVGVNWLVEERQLLARMAFEQNVSLSDFIRQQVSNSLRASHPAEHQVLTQLRERRRAQRLRITIRVARPAVGTKEDA